MSMYGIFNLVVFAALLSFLFQLAKKELGLSRSADWPHAGEHFWLLSPAGRRLHRRGHHRDTGVDECCRQHLCQPTAHDHHTSGVDHYDGLGAQSGEIKSLGKIGGSVVGILVVTTVIAAVIGIIMASLFGLNAGDLASGAGSWLARRCSSRVWRLTAVSHSC